MRKFFVLPLLLLLSFASFCQKELPEFGKSPIEDLQLKTCSFEPEATAMKLFDVTEAEFEYNQYGSRIKTEKRVRIKIFKEDGYQYASIKIPYYSKKSVSKIKALKGVVYNLDEAGNITIQKLEKKDFLRNKSDDNVGMINFTFPNLKPGSIIEYSYTRIENDIVQLDAWDVQDHIPNRYTANIIVTPVESRIKEKYFGLDTIEHSTQKIKGDREQRIYYKENVPSFHTEPYMTSFRDNLMRVSYLLIPRSNAFLDLLTSADKVWKFTGVELLQSKFFGGQMNAVIPGTDSLVAAAKKIVTIADRIQFLFEAVKKQAPEKVEQTKAIEDIAEAWKNKTGTSAELNLLLLNLLKKADVPCYPLLVSTRSHGQISIDFPNVSQFNGVDVLAADTERTYILDASSKWQSSHTPPANVLNRIALMLKPDDIKWVKLEDTRPLLRQNIYVQACLNVNGSLLGNATTTSYDYAKMALLDSSDKEGVEEKADKPDGLKIYQQRLVNSDKDDEGLQEQVAFELQSQKTDNFYFIKPQFLTSLKKNPFIKDARSTDIDLGCNQLYSYTLTIDLPPSCTVEFIPKNIILRAPDSSFFYKRICTQTASTVTYAQVFETRRSLFYREDYAAVRNFFKRLYGLMAEELIFKEKK